MRISAKADYAVRAAVELAAAPDEKPVKAERIATAQDIPLNFLENILGELRHAGIVRSHRGADGGFRLAKPADQLTVAVVWRRECRNRRLECPGRSYATVASGSDTRLIPLPSGAPMRFFEYESRAIVAKAGIPVTRHGFAKTADEAGAIAADIGGPVVIKSQVLSGGRMKAGGVKFADTPEEAAQHAEQILKLEIGGHMPRGVLVDSRAAVKHEYYAGVVWDGIRKRPVMLFSDMGGIDIEEVAEQHPDHVARRHFSTTRPFSDWQAKQLIASIGVTGSALNRLTPLVARLARLFLQYDMTLAEINPLGETEDGKFIALDAHMDMENEARPRQNALLAELEVGGEETRLAREPTPFELAGEEVDAQDHRGVAGNVTEFDGNLGLVIGAGGGSLTLFDAVRAHGGDPANYCEIGGNPSVRKACGLAKLVLQKPGVDKIAVMMSIVSNTRVDIVARGVIKACVELGYDPAEKIAIFRIPGAWEEEGFKILERYGVEYAERSVSLHEAARRAVVKIQGRATTDTDGAGPARDGFRQTTAEVGAETDV